METQEERNLQQMISEGQGGFRISTESYQYNKSRPGSTYQRVVVARRTAYNTAARKLGVKLDWEKDNGYFVQCKIVKNG